MNWQESILAKINNHGSKIYRNTLEVNISKENLIIIALLIKDLGGELVNLVAVDERFLGKDGFTLLYLFALPENKFVLINVFLEGDFPDFPSLTPYLPAANWYELQIKDLFGLTLVGHPEPVRLALHDMWPDNAHPLRKDYQHQGFLPEEKQPPFEFNRVSGEGVFEVPVGPIHAGIIEPGHFRFGVVGEKILHLDARLFYTHRGIEKSIEGKTLEEGLLFAERICGTCTVSHAASYCQAAETITGTEITKKAAYLRSFALEMERLYNHIGDLGNIGAGIGFNFMVYQFGRLKERLQALNQKLTGHRYLRGYIRLGGVAKEFSSTLINEILQELTQIKEEFLEIANIALSSEAARERFQNTGILPYKTAHELGAVGVAARASGVKRDSRVTHPHLAYEYIPVNIKTQTSGDVLARILVRKEEVLESFRLCQELLLGLPEGNFTVKLNPAVINSKAFGYSESPRGDNYHFLQVDLDGKIYRYQVRSASFCNWFPLTKAVPGNIVPDFPLINKSFELCYSCLDR